MARLKQCLLVCCFLFHHVLEAKILQCSEPAPVANAYRDWEGGAAGSYVTYSCLFSYVHSSGDLARVCNSSDGTYTGEPPICTLNCGEPADVVGASRDYSNITGPGSDVIYKCWEGYTPINLNVNKRSCSVEKGGWSGKPVVCSARLNLTAGVDYNTTQSSTMTSEDGTSYTSYHAVDGTDSYSRTLNESRPSWTMTLRPPYYDIHRVTLVLPQTNFSGPDVNISVKVIRGIRPYSSFSCKRHGPLTPPVYIAKCHVYAYGFELRVQAKYRVSGPLTLQHVQIFGRERGSGCEKPPVVVGVLYEYNDTGFGSYTKQYCDHRSGYHYHGGIVQQKCMKSNSAWFGWKIACLNNENIAVSKTVVANLTNNAYDVKLAVDDNVTSCITTAAADEHIFVLDLAENYEVKTVSASIPENVSSFETVTVTVSRHANGADRMCAYLSSSYEYVRDGVRTIVFDCYGNPWARYVTMTVFVQNSKTMELCEIRAFGRRQSDKPLGCHESYRGMEYKGQVNFTTSGKSCVRWDDVPNLPYDVDDFPDYSIEGAGNKCRNPRNKRPKPWCYTSLSGNYDYCPIAHCKYICTSGKAGDQYVGTVRQTKSGHKCQIWREDAPHEHDFKLSAAFADQNGFQSDYCRNPITSQTGPWCFTSNSSVRYEACNIPTCPTEFDELSVQAYNKSTLHTFEKQEHCFYWRGVNMRTLEPEQTTDACASKTAVTTLCSHRDGNGTHRWTYIHVDCIAPTTTTTTATATSTTEATSVLASTTVTVTPTAIVTTANISTATVTPANVTTANATTANVTNANVTTANVTTANITTASVTPATVTPTTVTTANVTTANVTTANIATPTVTTANVTTANVTTANVTTATVTTANVTTATVTTANVTTATVTTANVTTANVTTANVTTASVTPATVTPTTVTTANVTTANIATPTVTTATVTTANVTTATVTTANVTTATVTTANVTTANVTTANITTASVTPATVTPTTVTTANVTPTTVTTANVTNANVTTANITTPTVTTANVTTANVTTANITTASVTTANVTEAHSSVATTVKTSVTETNTSTSNITAIISTTIDAAITTTNTTTTSTPSETTTSLTVTTTSMATASTTVTPATGHRCPAVRSNSTSNETHFVCWCAPRYQVGDLASETEVTVARIRKHLTVDKTTLARQRRLLYSAPDYRTTSVAMGTSSIVIICLVVASLTLTDISRFIVWTYGKLVDGGD